MTTTLLVTEELLDHLGSQFNEISTNFELPTSNIAQLQKNVNTAEKNKIRDVKKKNKEEAALKRKPKDTTIPKQGNEKKAKIKNDPKKKGKQSNKNVNNECYEIEKCLFKNVTNPSDF